MAVLNYISNMGDTLAPLLRSILRKGMGLVYWY